MVAGRPSSSPSAGCVRKMLLLLVLSLLALLPVEALKCYDCMSKSLKDCTDGTKVNNFDQTQCKEDEVFCSTLVMKDTAGEELVTRQCASSRQEGRQLSTYIRASHDKDLTVVRFEVCQRDLCNTHEPHPSTRGGDHPSTFPSIGLLSLTMGTVIVLRRGV